MSFTPQLAAPPNPTEDRRSGLRRRLDRLTYAEFGPGNGGILLDISESGSRFQSVEPLTPGDLLPVSFVLTGTVGAVKAAAEIIWCNDSGKGGGLRFVDLPEEARNKIAAWVSSDPAPSAPLDGTPQREKGREKFNLLTTEGHLRPEPASDAAALAMARLLVSARGSSKLDPKRRDVQPSQNAPQPFDIDARPEGLVDQPAPSVEYTTAVQAPAVAREVPVSEPFVYETVAQEPIAEQSAEPPAATTEVAQEIAASDPLASSDHEVAAPGASEPIAEPFEPPAVEEIPLIVEMSPLPEPAIEVFEGQAIAEEVIAEAALTESEPSPEPLAFAEVTPAVESGASVEEIDITPDLASLALSTQAPLADEAIMQAEAAAVEALPEPPAEAPALEAAAIESHDSAPAETPAVVAEQVAEPEPLQVAPSSPKAIPESAPEPVLAAAAPVLSLTKPAIVEPAVPAPTFAPANKPKDSQLPQTKAPAQSLTYNGKHNKHKNNKKMKQAQRNPMGLPSLMDAPAAPSAKAAPPVPQAVPHWGVQVLRFAVGVGVGCCLVAGTFVGMETMGPGRRTFSLKRPRSEAVEAAAPSVSQPLEVEVVDLNSRRWHLSDNPNENAIDAALNVPQAPVVELTQDAPLSPLSVPAPVTATTTSHVPSKPQQSRKSGSKLLALQRPRIDRKAGSAGDVRAPSISNGTAPALSSSSLGSVEARGPAPVAPETSRTAAPVVSRPVFPTAMGTSPTRPGSQFQAPVLIEQVNPLYPPVAKQQHVTGTVRVNAIIGKEGIPHSLRVISGDARLAPAAIAAVSQWLYRPAQLNGETIESETTISVEFQLR